MDLRSIVDKSEFKNSMLKIFGGGLLEAFRGRAIVL